MSLRQNGLLGGLLFAAVAGLAFAPVVTAAQTWATATTAAALYLTLVSTAFVFLLGASRSDGLAAATVVTAVGLVTTLAADTLMPTVLGLTAAIGYGRARILFRKRGASAWLTELGIAVAALTAAEIAVSHSMRGLALALWAYWLAQSVCFLVIATGGDGDRPGPDPFDVAAKRATDLMDNAP